MNAPASRQRMPVEQRGQAYARLETDEEFLFRVHWYRSTYEYHRQMKTWTEGKGRHAVEHAEWESIDETVWRVEKKQRRILVIEPEKARAA